MQASPTQATEKMLPFGMMVSSTEGKRNIPHLSRSSYGTLFPGKTGKESNPFLSCYVKPPHNENKEYHYVSYYPHTFCLWNQFLLPFQLPERKLE